jgi:hypothetical protein
MKVNGQVIVGTHTDENGEVYLLVRPALTDEKSERIAEHNHRQAERLLVALAPFVPEPARRELMPAGTN